MPLSVCTWKISAARSFSGSDETISLSTKYLNIARFNMAVLP